MSFEANTFEQMHILNKNKRTAAIANEVGNYLNSTCGILTLDLTVDKKSYYINKYSFQNSAEIKTICSHLADAKEIFFRLRSSNNHGFRWRKKFGFLKNFSTAINLTKNIKYKSTDYYGQTPYIDLYKFDQNGETILNNHYVDDLTCVSDIKCWYCYSPEIFVDIREDVTNDKFYHHLLSLFQELICLTNPLQNAVIDEWKYGEIYWNTGFSFTNDQLKELLTILTNLFNEVKKHKSKLCVSINALPGGKEDYNFAALSITNDKNNINTSCCRF